MEEEKAADARSNDRRGHELPFRASRRKASGHVQSHNGSGHELPLCTCRPGRAHGDPGTNAKWARPEGAGGRVPSPAGSGPRRAAAL